MRVPKCPNLIICYVTMQALLLMTTPCIASLGGSIVLDHLDSSVIRFAERSVNFLNNAEGGSSICPNSECAKSFKSLDSANYRPDSEDGETYFLVTVVYHGDKCHNLGSNQLELHVRHNDKLKDQAIVIGCAFHSKQELFKVSDLSEELTIIDNWLQSQNLNFFGDPDGVAYPGGSPLFNERTGEQMSRITFLNQKFPDHPWDQRRALRLLRELLETAKSLHKKEFSVPDQLQIGESGRKDVKHQGDSKNYFSHNEGEDHKLHNVPLWLKRNLPVATNYQALTEFSATGYKIAPSTPEGIVVDRYLQKESFAMSGVSENISGAPLPTRKLRGKAESAMHVGDVSAKEKVEIDAWLKSQGLNTFGDKVGTYYIGGTPLFDEATATYLDRYLYIKRKFPYSPWKQP